MNRVARLGKSAFSNFNEGQVRRPEGAGDGPGIGL